MTGTKESAPGGWQIHFIDPCLIQPNGAMMRKHLAESTDEDFKKNVTTDLAHPISVRPLGRHDARISSFGGHKLSPKFEVFRGCRRWYAYLAAGLKIPARVIDISDKEALWKAYEENAYRTDLMADEEAEHILRLIDTELKGTPEYDACNNDPKKAVTVAYEVKIGQMPKNEVIRNVANSLVAKLDVFFEKLPRSKSLCVRSFYEHKLPLVDLPEKARDLKAGAQEALVGIRHEFARDVTMSWELKKKRRTPIRVLEKRARTLNSNAKLLEQVPNGKKKEKVIRLALKTGMSPKKLELELENLLPKMKEEERAAPFENHDEMVQAYCPRDSISMPEVKDGSVRLIVTSPPYGGKITFEGDYLSKAKTPNEFFSEIEPIMAECFRVLAPGGKLVINWADPIGDWANEEAAEKGEYAEHIYAHRWVELAEKVGFRLWARQIWQKNVYYSIAQRRVRYEDALHTDGKTHLDWEWILTFRKPGPAPEGRSKLSYQKWKKYTKGVWYIKGAQSKRGLAAFPPELVSRLIQLHSFKGDLVLDPFLGTGTTVAVAKKLGRRGVGYEINPDLKTEIKRTLELA